MNSTEVQNPRRKLDVFSSLLACAKSDHVFQKLSYSLCGLCLSLSLHNSSSDSKAFLHFIAFSGSPTAVHCAFLVSMQRHGHSHQLSLHVHYGITLWAYLPQMHRPVLHCGHTFLRCIDRYCTVGIPLWTSRKRSHKRPSSTEKPQYHVLQLTWSHIYCYVRVTERYMEILHMKKMAALVAVSL